MSVFLLIGVSSVEKEDGTETNTNQETVFKAGRVRQGTHWGQRLPRVAGRWAGRARVGRMGLGNSLFG